MAKIEFKKLSLRNFMSYGNKTTEVYFDDLHCLITGKNGHGKSTIFMALYYALYGKTYKKVKLGSLINTTNNKDLFTEIIFEINSVTYRIIRGQKPNIFEIYENEVLVDQSASSQDYQDYLETYILKIPEHVFKQLIFFGANVAGNKTFMELTKSEKEEMFSTITDTSVFGLIRDNINTKVKENKTLLAELTYKMDVLKQSILSEQANIKKMEEHNLEAQTLNESRKLSSQNDLSSIEDKIQELSEKLNEIKDLKPKYEKLSQMITELEGVLVVKNLDIRKQEKTLDSINIAKTSFGTCIGCDKLKFVANADINEEPAVLESIASISSEIAVHQEKLSTYKAKQKVLYDRLLEGKGTKDTLLNLEQQRTKIEEALKASDISLMEIDYSVIEKQKSQYKKAQTKKEQTQKLSEDLAKLNKLMDNNNLKGVILNQQLPVLNKYINEYLNEFSSEIKFTFFIDQNFKENMIQRGKEIEVHSLSNGYNLRLTFSIMFAFLKLVQERSGIDTNLLVIDEGLDNSLDVEGRAELIRIIKNDFKNKTVFVISHNDEIKNNIQDFDKVYSIENNGFSSIREI